ncbi:MAG: hypothetical protein AAF849_20520 [Bacteroidota bacterium]
MQINQLFNATYDRLLSEETKERSERVILSVAIASYIIHLLVIFSINRGWIELESAFTKDPIAAIYTPFSFILVYEVYLLIFYLPKSITIYIGKQYEIITLILIRRIFKDIANIELTSNWFEVKDDVQFTYDILTSVVLFFLIYLFYQQIKKRTYVSIKKEDGTAKDIRSFIKLKKIIAAILVPTLLLMAIVSFFNWATDAIYSYQNSLAELKDINDIFFDEFFTILIIVDVLLLLASFYYSHQFHKIIRNSGFIISTILIKISFSVDGFINIALIIGAVVFGLMMLFIHNRYEENISFEEESEEED